MVWRLRNSRNKYHAETCVHNGIAYNSQAEAAYAAELDLRIKASDIKSWERQIKMPLDVNGRHITNYYVDFLIHHNDGTDEYVEIKGMHTEVFRLKRLLFEAVYPAVRYTLIQV